GSRKQIERKQVVQVEDSTSGRAATTNGALARSKVAAEFDGRAGLARDFGVHHVKYVQFGHSGRDHSPRGPVRRLAKRKAAANFVDFVRMLPLAQSQDGLGGVLDRPTAGARLQRALEQRSRRRALHRHRMENGSAAEALLKTSSEVSDGIV